MTSDITALAAQNGYQVSAVGKKENVSKEEMSLAEYKAKINKTIAEIPMHPSQYKIHSTITISEEGYKAMMEDPEYEAWVLGYIKEDRSVDMGLITNNPNLRSYGYLHFGASKAEFKGCGWSEYVGPDKKGGDKEKKGKKLFESSADLPDIWEKERLRRLRMQEQREADYWQKTLQQRTIRSMDAYEQSMDLASENVLS